MPSEQAISRMMEIFTDVIDLGGTEERTAIAPNLSVIDAAPTGLTNFIIVQDDRDGDNILAKTVPGVVYANNDKVNVLFIKGAEPIAFQQGSESSSANLWQIVPSTSTDIFYNSGDVGIGKSVAPDASLEILDTAQAQLRLTHTEDTKFVDFTLDTNHDLTIIPSSTGQIIMQPTTDSVDFFQVLDADGGTPVLNVDSTNERVGIGTAAPLELLQVESSIANLARIRIVETGDTTSGHVSGIGLYDSTTFKGGLFKKGDDHFIQLWDGSSARLTLDQGGNIGIGIASPGNKLDIVTGATTSSSVHIGEAIDEGGYLTSLVDHQIILSGGAEFVSGSWTARATSAAIMSTDTGSLTWFTNGSLTDGNTYTPTERMRLDTSGQLGIGTNSPSTRLDIDAGAIEFVEMTAPGAGAVNTARLYAVDDGAGKTQLAVIFNTGAVQVLATQP